MLFVDRLYIALLWLRWRAARYHWSLIERVNRRTDLPPHVRRRLTRFEYRAWSYSCASAARLDREQRRVYRVR